MKKKVFREKYYNLDKKEVKEEVKPIDKPKKKTKKGE